MARQEVRRINPIAHITLVVVIILLVFEVLVIGGVFEFKAQTIAKYAPWAYESFIRLVGEHLDSAPRWAEVEEAEEIDKSTLPDGVVLSVGDNETTEATNVVPDVVFPPETDAESNPVVVPTNTPPFIPEGFLPVG